MINTVIGPIAASELGLTLMHEHLVWSWEGPNRGRSYSIDDALDYLTPQLIELKQLGCKTLVDGTPSGCGRDIEILRLLSHETGLNIITNCGMWDGGNSRGQLIPYHIHNLEVEEISQIWIREFANGILGTSAKPGFIKLALGDEGYISKLQNKMLLAAIQASIKTGLPIECHTSSPISALEAVNTVDKEGLPLRKFIWLHIDWPDNLASYSTIFNLAQRGIFVEIDNISCYESPCDFSKQINLLQRLLADGLEDKILLSQDGGAYGEQKQSTRPYTKLLTEFIPACLEVGIAKTAIEKILIDNPAKILDIDSI